MKKFILIVVLIASGYGLSYSEGILDNRNINTDKKSNIDASCKLGSEFYNYQESDPTTNSISKPWSIVSSFDLHGHFQYLQIGAKGVFPLVIGRNTENWKNSNGVTYQVNKLNYYWSRFDFYIGCGARESFMAYIGLRDSEGIQRRSGLPTSSGINNGGATERIKSSGFLFGYKGDYSLVDNLKWDFCLEYTDALSVRVTNTSIPGFSFDEQIGHTFEIKNGLSYRINQRFSADVNFYAGRMYWQGSPWLYNPASFTWVKWPSNKTDYLGISFGASLWF